MNSFSILKVAQLVQRLKHGQDQRQNANVAYAMTPLKPNLAASSPPRSPSVLTL